MNDLLNYFNQNDKRLIGKWMHYFDIYERHFEKYRNKEIVILEIGVAHGGSLQMWKQYFGSKAKIFGIDINPECKNLEEENIEIFIGSQTDRKFLKDVAKQIPPIDILIDDGGHSMTQQIISFEELYKYVKPDGVYLCEDLHTSYKLKYGGGIRRRGTFIEYSKKFIDQINAFHSEQESFKIDDITKSAWCLHYYDSVLVIEKRPIVKPTEKRTGQASFNAETLPPKKLKYFILYSVNYLLRVFRLPGFRWR